MRVLFVQNYWTPYRNALFNALSATTEIGVVYLSEIGDGRRWRESDVRYPVQTLSARKVGPFYLSDLRSVSVEQWDCVVLVENLPNALSVLALRKRLVAKRIPFVIWTGEYLDRVYQQRLFARISGFLKHRFRRRLYAESAGFFAYSTRTVHMLLQYGVERDAITIVPQAIEIDYPQPDPPEDASSELRLVFVGYLYRLKNVEALIQAAARSDSHRVRLTIVGDGEDRQRLVSLAGHKVEFLGHRSGQDKYRVLESSDVLVLPSLRDAWGFVINEALYFGLPVICSREAGAADAIDGCGLIVNPTDVDDICNAIRYLADNPDVRVQMGRRAQEVYDRYTIDRAAETIRAALDRIA